VPSIANRDIDSTPPPRPISICLALMAFAMFITAFRPEEQSLFELDNVVVSGNPARNVAILATIAPEPGYSTFPMHTSSTSLGSILAY